MMVCDISVNGYHLMDAEDEVMVYVEDFKKVALYENIDVVERMLAGDGCCVEAGIEEVLYTVAAWSISNPELGFKIDAIEGPHEYEIFIADGEVNDFREEFIDENDEGLDYEQLNEDFVREEFEECSVILRLP